MPAPPQASLSRRELEEECKEVGRLLKADLPPGVGFFLSLFDINQGWSAYMSNAKRKFMVKYLRELITELEEQ